MINLDNIELVIFDFDDTLCIHSKHSDLPGDEEAYNIRVLQLGARAWNHCEKSIHLQKFINICKEKQIRMGLCSSTSSFVHMQCKNEWVYSQYGVNLENYCVGKPEKKLDILKAISEAQSIKRENILIVDDYWLVLEMVANEGFMACTPMEVVNYIERLMN